MKRKITLIIVLSAVMAALSISLDLLSLKIDMFNKITIYGLPLMFVSVFFGPFVGLLTGIVSGFISQMIQYGMQPTTILWMIAPIIWGTTGGIYIKLLKPKKPYSLINILLIVLITSFFASLINTLVLWVDSIIWNYTIEQTLLTIAIRLGIAAIMCIPYTALLYIITNRLKTYSWINNKTQDDNE